MRLVPTRVAGCFVVEVEPSVDGRGLFARTFDVEVFALAGIEFRIAQSSVSFNDRARTLRGLHYQAAPHAEQKLVRCTAGRVFDVAVDVDPSSTTFRSWVGVELTPANRRALFVPSTCAHGFLTLEPSAELLYDIDVPYVATAARGVRWDDPSVGVEWPDGPAFVMSERDRTLPWLG